MRCKSCGIDAVAEATYCTRCGAALTRPSAIVEERTLEDARLVVSLTPRQVLTYGLLTSLLLFAVALIASWAPALHIGPGIDALCGLLAGLASILGIVVQLTAAATAIRMLGPTRLSTSETEGRRVSQTDGHAPLAARTGERLLGAPPSVVEHTTFRLTVPESLPRARTTADQG